MSSSDSPNYPDPNLPGVSPGTDKKSFIYNGQEVYVKENTYAHNGSTALSIYNGQDDYMGDLTTVHSQYAPPSGQFLMDHVSNPNLHRAALHSGMFKDTGTKVNLGAETPYPIWAYSAQDDGVVNTTP